jgi:hypothetical protein
MFEFPTVFNGNNILDAPVFAPEEHDVYSFQRDTARALQRSAMDAITGNISLLAERWWSSVSGL